jgi:hypothetical protein
VQVKGVADAGAASLRVSGLELGGLFGSLLAGKLSDMLINNSKGSGGNVGKRIQVGGRSGCGWVRGWLESGLRGCERVGGFTCRAAKRRRWLWASLCTSNR